MLGENQPNIFQPGKVFCYQTAPQYRVKGAPPMVIIDTSTAILRYSQHAIGENNPEACEE